MAQRDQPRLERREKPQKQWLVPFWFVVTGSVLMAVVLAVVGTFVPIDYFSVHLRDETADSCSSAVAIGNELLADLVYTEVTNTSYVSLLHSIELNIMGFVMEPAYSAVGALGGSIATQNEFGNGWTGNRDFNERVQLSRFAWASLEPQWLDTLGTQMSELDTQVNNWRRARTTNLQVGFASGQRIGTNFQSDRVDYCSDKVCSAECWQYDKESNGPTIETVQVTLGSTAPFDCREQCQSYAGCSYWTLISKNGSEADCILKNASGDLEYREDAISGIPNCVPDLSENIQSYGYVADGTTMSFWEVDSETGTPKDILPIPVGYVNTTNEPWYLPQTQLAKQGRSLAGAWSEIYVYNDNLAIAWTLPVAYCGDYSCMDGVVATTIGLAGVSYDAFGLWLAFRERLSQPPYEFPIGTDNSSMFIVSRAARSPAQEGLLIGCSDGCPGVPGADNIRDLLHVDGELPYADNFSKPAVTATSRAILRRFGTWNNESLEDHQMFTFNPNSVDNIFEPGAYCHTGFDQARQDGECWQASTISVRLDEDTAWLVVLVLPAAAFAQKSSEVARKATIQVQEVEESSDLMITSARQWTAIVALVVLVLSACLGTCLGFHVSGRLRELADLTQRLSNLDFTQPSKLKSGCRISDVTNLQQAFCGLTRGIEAFARFVPEPVVRSLVHGQNIKMEERRVTILCSDIEGFTKISETLGHVELLFMLTRYLSVMQRVVHMYKGVVAEILGDGLLIYWNTPDDVENHAELACAAAVLMQDKVMDLLNDEFSSVDLPRIKIRIGIHTALVSSGTVGSEMKKKFGCLGSGVDIADHLESSCKFYQTQSLVSEHTINALSPDSGFSFSEVGVEQIEGEELKIYELIARDWSPGGGQAEEGEMPSAPEGPEDVAATPVTIEVARTASPSGQHQSPGGFVGMNAVRSRRSNGSNLSFGREPSMESGYGAGRALSRRTSWQDDADAAQAVAESGESLQRRLAESGESLQEGMLRLLQSTNSVATLPDPTSSAHAMRI